MWPMYLTPAVPSLLSYGSNHELVDNSQINFTDVFPTFVKVQRKERCPLYNLRSLQRQLRKMQNASNEKERFQVITYQETIDYQLECMLLPLQFKLYMLELRGRS